MIKSLTTFLLLSIFVTSSFAQKKGAEMNEVNRPQFHFSIPENWLGQPAASLFVNEQLHLFYEYSPVGTTAIYTNMGHAVSTDLLHYDIQAVALDPDEETRDLYRCTVRSGSAVIDDQNLLGKQEGDTPVQVVFYSSMNCGIRMAYSTDGGTSWTKYADNPLIPYLQGENARDPKVFWHAGSGAYVMVVARNPKDSDVGEGLSFYSSKNLVDWTYSSHLIGLKGRPDLFEMPFKRREDDTRWVLTDSIGQYLIGDFDGRSFTAETGVMRTEYGTAHGATSFWVDIEGESRLLQIANIDDKEVEGMPSAGVLSFPAELSLKNYIEGVRLVKSPARELEKLQGKPIVIKNHNIIPGLNKNPIKRIKGDCFRFTGTFELKTVSSFGFMLRGGKSGDGTEIRYDATRGQLSCLGKVAPLSPEDGKIKLDVLVDRSTIEIYGNDGKVVISVPFSPKEGDEDYILYNTGGELYIEQLEIFPIASVYQSK